MIKTVRNRKKYIPALGYHVLTPFYDCVVAVAGGGNLYMDTLIGQAQLENKHRILDVACGTGTLAAKIKQSLPSAEVIALDCDAKMLSRAERKAGQANAKIQFDCAYAEELPYVDHYFDRVVSSLFFHHLVWNDKKQVASEMFRVMKPGGELHVIDWGKASNGLMRTLFLPVQLLDGFSNTQDNISGKLIELFEKAGFLEVKQQRSFNTIFGTLALYSAIKKK